MKETPEINNRVEKPMHGKIEMNSSNVGASTNVLQKDNIDISNDLFDFLQNKDNSDSVAFKLDGAEIENIYLEIKNNCKLAICIIVENDMSFNSILLKKTLDGIKYNLPGINKLIEPENILICVFFKEIKGNSIFNDQDKYLLNNQLSFILSRKIFNVESDVINVHCFSKIDIFKDVEILDLYYCTIIQKLRPNNTIIFSAVLKNGVVINSNALDNLLKVSFFSRQNHSIVVPLLQDDEPQNLFSKIKAYERFHFNIYNMNFYNMSSSVPISSLFNIMTIDDKLSNQLKDFYKEINNNSTIDYHDYRLSLYLYKYKNKIIYYNDKPMATVNYPDEFESPICNYKKYWVSRYSGYYGNFFRIIEDSFLNFDVCNTLKKIFLFFNIIAMMIEFIYPSLSIMVIYTIFFEAFDTYDIFPAAFFTLLYLFIVICCGVNSLITKNSQKTFRSNLAFYFFMEVYYLFLLICAIVAMDNIKKNKNHDPYKFNNAAISCIIIFIFIPSILPIMMNASKFINNLVPMLLYLVLGAPSSTSNFQICKILNASDASGGKNIKERKGIYIISFFLINLFFGSLTLYNYTREKRVKAVMGFGIFYLIYNFFKMIAICMSLLSKDSDVSNVTDTAIKNNLFNNNYQNNYGSSSVDNQNNSINNNSNNNNNMSNNMSNNNQYAENIDNDYE